MDDSEQGCVTARRARCAPRQATGLRGHTPLPPTDPSTASPTSVLRPPAADWAEARRRRRRTTRTARRSAAPSASLASRCWSARWIRHHSTSSAAAPAGQTARGIAWRRAGRSAPSRGGRPRGRCPERRPQLVGAQHEPRPVQGRRPRESERVPGQPGRRAQERQPVATVIRHPRGALKTPHAPRIKRAVGQHRSVGARLANDLRSCWGDHARRPVAILKSVVRKQCRPRFGGQPITALAHHQVMIPRERWTSERSKQVHPRLGRTDPPVVHDRGSLTLDTAAKRRRPRVRRSRVLRSDTAAGPASPGDQIPANTAARCATRSARALHGRLVTGLEDLNAFDPLPPPRISRRVMQDVKDAIDRCVNTPRRQELVSRHGRIMRVREPLRSGRAGRACRPVSWNSSAGVPKALKICR